MVTNINHYEILKASNGNTRYSGHTGAVVGCGGVGFESFLSHKHPIKVSCPMHVVSK